MNKVDDKIFDEIISNVRNAFIIIHTDGTINHKEDDYLRVKLDEVNKINNTSTYSGMSVLNRLHPTYRRTLMDNFSFDTLCYIVETEGWESINYWIPPTVNRKNEIDEYIALKKVLNKI